MDTHVGSGSSRIAAYFAGIDFYGCEIDKDYFDKQQRRFEEECLNIITNPDTGQIIVEQKLFDLL